MASYPLTPADVREICQQWASGAAYPASYEERSDQLDHLIPGNESLWWDAIQEVVRSTEKDTVIYAEAPAEALLRVGGEAWVERFAALARSDDRFAYVLTLAHPRRWEVEFPRVLLELVGEERTFRAYCSYHSAEGWPSFWAWEVVHDAITGLASVEPAWGRAFLLRLVDGVDPDCLGLVGAGPVEDYVFAYASRDVDWLEAQVRAHPPLVTALRGINWPDHHARAVLDRLHKAIYPDR